MTESESSRRYREEMEAKYSSDPEATRREQQKKRNKEDRRKASDDYNNWVDSNEKLDKELDIENKKVARKLGWLESIASVFIGAGDGTNEVADTYNESDSEELPETNKEQLRPVTIEEGVLIDGLMYKVTTWTDASKTQERM